MLVKNEFNVILNPTHAFYTKIKASKPEAAFLDERYANLL